MADTFKNEKAPVTQNNILGRRIRDLRKQNHMRQEDLADILEVRKTTVSNYETGYSYPKRAILVKLSKLFQVPIDRLCEDTEQLCNDPTHDVQEYYYDMQQLPQYRFDTEARELLECKHIVRVLYLSRRAKEGATFSTIVPDNGMDRLGLRCGDEVLVKQQCFADSGQVVLAHLPDLKKLVIRRFTQSGRVIRLLPDTYEQGVEPFVLDAINDKLNILGIISGAIVKLG